MSLRTTIFVVAALVSGTSSSVLAEQVLFSDDFESGLSDLWIERGFPSIERKNEFAIATDPDGNRYLQVVSDRSTSGRGVWVDFDPDRCPTISWRWKISNVVERADLRRKDGDDAAAKIYVIFTGPSRWNPLDKRMLIYVWDNRIPVGTVLPNAWEPAKARMVVLKSGADDVGKWVSLQVDIANDYRRAYPGEEPSRVEAVVFMADTDNTESRVFAGVDDLSIVCGDGKEAKER